MSADAPPSGVPAEALRLVRQCRRALSPEAAPAEDDGDGEHDDWIHLTRVTTKRLRAAWHLLRDLVGKEAVQAAATRLKALSAAVSEHRDDAVRLKVIRELREAPPPRARRARTKGGARKASPPAPPLAEAVWERLKQGATAADSNQAGEAKPDRPVLDELWREEEAAWRALSHPAGEERKPVRRALRRSRRKAKALATRAMEETDAELWHDWRKKVKRLRYQQEIVARLQDRKTGPRHARLSKLGSLLGHRNDLAALRDWLKSSESPVKAAELGALLRFIGEQEAPLLAKARRLGRGLA